MRLLDLMREATDAQEDLRACRAECEFDAGYFCQRQERAVIDADAAVEAELNRIIDERIAQKLAYERSE